MDYAMSSNLEHTRRSGVVGNVVATLLAVLGGLLIAMPAAAQTKGKCVTIQDIQKKGGWDIVTQVPGFEPYWFADEKGNFQGQDYDLLVEVNK